MGPPVINYNDLEGGVYSRVRAAGSRSYVIVAWWPESTLSPACCVLITEVTPAAVADLRVPGVNTGLTAGHRGQSQAWGLPVTFATSSLNIRGVGGGQGSGQTLLSPSVQESKIIITYILVILDPGFWLIKTSPRAQNAIIS